MKSDNPHREDAEKFLSRYCRPIAVVHPAQQHLEYGYEIWIPKVVEAYLRENGRPRTPERSAPESIWTTFYDAAWELCRRGILRPSEVSPHGMGSPRYTDADGFSLTSSGRGWLQRTSDQWLPTDAGRFVAALAKASALCGNAFTQRAHEAARCNEAANYLACCAMCGAASESIILALAAAKTRDRDGVLSIYRGAQGRSRVLSRITGQLTAPLRESVSLGFDLLKYWRDAAAHGHAIDIGEMEAYLALFTLFRFAVFASDNWAELTA